MSSMRNAVQRRQHRERGQLQGREKWGILEKHKDYSLRAKDYNMKKQKIKRLEEKARDRNPDEFAFGMMSSHSSTKGKHGTGMRESATAQGLSHEAIKLLKTQDAGYLRTVGERVRRQMEKVEEDLRIQESVGEALGDKDDSRYEEDDDDFDGFDFGAAEKKARKLVFADDREDQKVLKRALAQREQEGEDEEEDGEEGSFGERAQQQKQQQQKRKTRKELEAEKQALIEARRARKIKKRALEVRQNKLKALQKQYAHITSAERALDLQRAKMSNSVGGVNKNGLKFKIKERKR
ncbi:small-subunit processome [Aspergillus falconensis]